MSDMANVLIIGICGICVIVTTLLIIVRYLDQWEKTICARCRILIREHTEQEAMIQLQKEKLHSAFVDPVRQRSKPPIDCSHIVMTDPEQDKNN